jgi:hypothetical protein
LPLTNRDPKLLKMSLTPLVFAQIYYKYKDISSFLLFLSKNLYNISLAHYLFYGAGLLRLWMQHFTTNKLKRKTNILSGQGLF